MKLAVHARPAVEDSRTSMWRRAFVEHPASVGETYLQHMEAAFSFGWRMVAAGCACLMHGVLPFLFVKTGSSTVRHLHEEMIRHRSRKRAAPEWLDQGAYI